MYSLVSPYPRSCPTESCPLCGGANFKRNGTFLRKDDGRRIQRYYCKSCCRSFSRAGYSVFYRQRHRRLNQSIRQKLVRSGTLRGIAFTLGIDKDTVSRHMVAMARYARARHDANRKNWPLANTVQLDDLHTTEHIRVSKIPSSGLLAKKSRAKYGPRPDESIAARDALMTELAPFICPEVEFVSDMHHDYPPLIRRHFPYATHTTSKSSRSAVVGQGELKKIGHDPLFCINHQFAMLRAHISRLVRRTWNTTKKLARLEDHLILFVDYYNEFLRPAGCHL